MRGSLALVFFIEMKETKKDVFDQSKTIGAFVQLGHLRHHSSKFLPNL